MTNATSVPTVALRDGVEIPQLGLGVFRIPPGETQEVVEEALAAGYHHIDTAAAYGNEAGVGAAIAASACSRENLFVTTKLWNSEQGYDSTLRAFEQSLRRLGLDRVDLYLIHWPVPAADRYLDSWRALERIQEEGLSRSIGVSNFRIEDLRRLQVEVDYMPTINQIELHPRLQQPQLRAWHAEHGIATEAWSPLAQATLLAAPAIEAIAARHERTPAQAILRWHLQLGNVAIPKTATLRRLRENIDLFDFELSAEDMGTLARLDAGERIGPDPATFGAR